jgi:hypothetical protein
MAPGLITLNDTYLHKVRKRVTIPAPQGPVCREQWRDDPHHQSRSHLQPSSNAALLRTSLLVCIPNDLVPANQVASQIAGDRSTVT